jgi:hypothetical protein
MKDIPLATFCTLGLAAVFASTASGAEVYGNSTTARPNGGVGASANFANARFQTINFNTGSSSLLGIDEGWLLLRNSTGGSVDLTVGIYGDSSSAPSTTLFGSTTLTVTSDGLDSWRHFTFSSPLTGLTTNTDYWLVLSSPATLSVNWLKPGSTDATFGAISSSGYEVAATLQRGNSSDGTTWAFGAPAEMGFQLGAVSVVPEPATYATFAGAGILVFAVWQRRRKARFAPAGEL